MVRSHSHGLNGPVVSAAVGEQRPVAERPPSGSQQRSARLDGSRTQLDPDRALTRTVLVLTRRHGSDLDTITHEKGPNRSGGIRLRGAQSQTEPHGSAFCRTHG